MIHIFGRISFDPLIRVINKKLISDNVNKKCLSTISNQLKLKKIERIHYPKREPYLKDRNENLLLDIATNNNLNINKNYYKILGLSEQASVNDIKRAYHILAKKFQNPDRMNKKNYSFSLESEKFKEIAEAYNVLSDERKRVAYDEKYLLTKHNSDLVNKSALNSDKFITKKLNSFLNDNIEIEPVPEIYNTSEVNITITFLQAIQGITKDINVKSLTPCTNCDDRFDTRNVPLILCKNCKGTGMKFVTTKNKERTVICNTCQGTKYISDQDCKVCRKRRYVPSDINVPIKIPPGTKTNDVIYVKHPLGKQTLKVRIKVIDNEKFERIGNDIYTEKQLTLTEAALGGKFSVRGVYGNILLILDPGTDPLSEKRLTGQGIKAKSGIGDLIVKFIVKMPKRLTTKQKSLLTMLQRIERNTSVDGHYFDDDV